MAKCVISKAAVRYSDHDFFEVFKWGQNGRIVDLTMSST